MTTIVPIDQITDLQRGGVISIGNFDGVHRGHARLLKEVRRLADDHSCPSVAVVLHPHPATVLRPAQAPPRLSSIARRAERMSDLGIDFLVVCPSTPEFLRLSAQTFFDQLIVNQLCARAVVEGPNFYFGRDRGGSVQTLGQLCDQANIELSIVAPVGSEDQMISSTRIRELLQNSDVENAAQLLGSWHRVAGQVVAGDRRGRQIGFPTANLTELDGLIPAHGVYGGYGICQGESRPAAIHIGPNPTFEKAGPAKLEVHLLDFEGDLYGQQMLVDFVVHVRDVIRFDSVDQLSKQLSADIAEIRSRLKELRKKEK